MEADHSADTCEIREGGEQSQEVPAKDAIDQTFTEMDSSPSSSNQGVSELEVSGVATMSPSEEDNLATLESTMSIQKLERFKKSYEEGYDLQTDAEHNKWKELRSPGKRLAKSSPSKRKSTPNSCLTPLTTKLSPRKPTKPTPVTPVTSQPWTKVHKSLSPAFFLHLTYPGTPKKKKNGKAKTSQMPSNPSGEIAISMGHKKREDRKKAEALKLKREREREEKRINKQKEEERKQLARAEKKRKKQEMNQEKYSGRIKKGGVKVGGKRKWRGEPARKEKKEKPARKARKPTITEEDENECQKCGGTFVEGQVWIQCGNEEEETGCLLWFHLKCTDVHQSITKEELEQLVWYCEACLEEYC